MKGSMNIPQLHLTVLREVMRAVPVPPSTIFTNLFPNTPIASDAAQWEIELTSSGISPMVAPGAQAPLIGMEGFTSASAKVAFWKEKMYFDEAFLNNLRRVGSLEKESAETVLARGITKLTYRSMRRKEWMCCKAALDGKLVYNDANGLKMAVDYKRPSQNTITLASDRKWGTGQSRNPVEDVYDVKALMSDFYGINISDAYMTFSTLKLLLMDSKVQDLLKSSAFGSGDLFANPAAVIGNLLGIGTIHIMDEYYELDANILAVNGTTITVDNPTNYEVGTMVYLDQSGQRYMTERKKVTAVSPSANTITIESAFSSTPVAGRDRLVAKKKFIDDNSVLFLSSTIEGAAMGEFLQSPHGLEGVYGRVIDSDETYDPEGVYVRVRDKGLPILRNPAACAKLIVA